MGNCHKLPEKEFTRRRLTVDEIVSDYVSLLSGLLARNSGLKVIFTVSPIRHAARHACNQLSKSVLLLAVDRLQAAFPENVFYFPAYELVLDELRDYRSMPKIWCILPKWRRSMFGSVFRPSASLPKRYRS